MFLSIKKGLLNIMKKGLILLLATLGCVSLASCGGNSNESSTTGSISSEPTTSESSSTTSEQPEEEVPNKIEGVMPWDETAELTNFYDGGDKVFTKNGPKKFSWSHETGCSSFIKADIQGTKAFDKIEVSITVSTPTIIVVKEENSAVEQTLTFTAEELTQVASLTIPTNKILSIRRLIILPLENATAAKEGSLEINYAKLYVHGVGMNQSAAPYLVGHKDLTFERSSQGTMLEWIKKTEDMVVGFRLDPSVDFSTANAIEIKLAGAISADNLKVIVNDTQDYLATGLEATTTITITKAIDAINTPWISMYFDYGLSKDGFVAIQSIKILAVE